MGDKVYSSFYFHYQNVLFSPNKRWQLILFVGLFIWPVLGRMFDFLMGIFKGIYLIFSKGYLSNLPYLGGILSTIGGMFGFGFVFKVALSAFLFLNSYFVYTIYTKLKISFEGETIHFHKKSCISAFQLLYRKGLDIRFNCSELNKITIKTEKKGVYSPILRGLSQRRYEPFLWLEIPGQQFGFYPLEVKSADEKVPSYEEKHSNIQEEIMDMLNKSGVFLQLKHKCKNTAIVFDDKIYEERIQRW